MCVSYTICMKLEGLYDRILETVHNEAFILERCL